MACDKRLLNIVMLGFGFMGVFTAFQTTGLIQKVVLDSLALDESFTVPDGYTLLAIIYIIFALSNWVAPSIVSVIGPRISMLIGGITYVFYIAIFLYPETWLLYLASCIIGVGAALIWTGQGNYLTINSDSNTISRNSGIFWALLQSSMFIGNVFIYFQFLGKTHIDKATRKTVFIVLTAIGLVGLVVLAVLRPARTESGDVVNEESNPKKAFVDSVKLFFTKKMLLLSFTIIYTGVELSFYSGVYSSSVGFTMRFGTHAKELVAISGILIGVGEVLGGILFGLLGSKTASKGRTPIVIIGFFVHVVAFALININIPNNAPFSDTLDSAIIEPIAWLAVFCSFLLGLGDSCYNTQVMAMLGDMYKDHSAPAFAIFKFTQSTACGLCLLYSSRISLYPQLGILYTLAFLGTVSFGIVEYKEKKSKQQIE